MERLDADRVLLVEDQPDQAKLVRRWLELSGYEVEVAPDGHTALRALLFEPRFDLIICDVELPGINGLEVARQARRLDGETALLLVTAHEKMEYALEAVRSGADEMALKPLSRKTLVERARNLVRRAERARRAKTKTVMAIGAHPDDVEIGVGATLIKHADRGDKIVIVTLTGGEAGGETAIRAGESMRAAERLGAELVMGSLPDTRIFEGGETIELIERAIAEHRPDIVYTHSSNDVHQDHRAAHRASIVACRSVPNLLCYQSPSATTAFRPALYVDVERQLDRKLQAIAEYGSQTAKCAYLDPELIRSTARYWGRFSRSRFVEPVEIIRTTGALFAASEEDLGRPGVRLVA